MMELPRKGGEAVFARVIVDIVHENVAHSFTYRVPEGMALSPGQRVAVPFGPRRLEGVVTELTEETGAEKVCLGGGSFRPDVGEPLRNDEKRG